MKIYKKKSGLFEHFKLKTQEGWSQRKGRVLGEVEGPGLRGVHLGEHQQENTRHGRPHQKVQGAQVRRF